MPKQTPPLYKSHDNGRVQFFMAQDSYEMARQLGGAEGAPPAAPAKPGAAPGTSAAATAPQAGGAVPTPGTPGVERSQFPSKKKVQAKKKVKKKGPEKREIMSEGDTVQSETHTWRVIKLLGSGGFGDVYKVVKHNDPDKTVNIY
ncbi:hypothetical protein ANCDUO_04772 [Ancylostoma duodenale]|uniref:Protein kinase domain-containing protein n=1 Tax=Ancylostoma duodenale TaxID=51022 RepID=A0A0C2D5S0_9BILA|nr:hypothetical protein ANCDUO_04772 [Ancylostoma duodenale]